MNVGALLQQVQQAELLRFTTAGSVDDGKSTLIGRLLHDAKGIYEDHLAAIERDSRRNGQQGIDFALLTDGLKAEREQRITIDVAYRHFSTPRRRFIIADTPGHEQYTRNMVTGASTADLALILIDARHGVVTQSRRHGFIAALLGIPRLVIAINKMDLAGYARETYERIRDEYAAWATRLFADHQLAAGELTFIPISALRGDNVVRRSEAMPWYDGPALLEFLETVPIPRDRGEVGFRLPVQHVLRPNGDFRGYAGTIASGEVRLGDRLVVLPSGRASRVERILTPSGEEESAGIAQSVTLCLEDDIDISRGDMLVQPDRRPDLADELEATLIWMDTGALAVGRPYLIKHTTNLVRGECVALDCRIDPNTLEHQSTETLRLNEIGRARLRLFRPLACDPYIRNRQTGSFIMIDPVSNNTVAAGLIRASRSAEATGNGTDLDIKNQPSAGPSAPVAKNITLHTSRVTAADRARLMRQRPATLWLTGLSGAGKSTLAYALEQRLIASGQACVVLDGDNLRHGLNRDLGFTAQDRSENIRRVAEVARLFNEAGLLVITSFISPYRADRAQARTIIGAERFIEGFVDAPLAECERRDPKGLYAKARAGRIEEFTGISAPYEAPTEPDLRLDTADCSVDELVQAVWSDLIARGILG